MADYTVTTANVFASSDGNAQVNSGIAGVAITAGNALYVDSANGGVMKLADSNASSPANTFAGIALNSASTGQPVSYAAVDPDFQPGFSTFSSTPVYLSNTPGKLTGAFDDLAEGSNVILVGIMKQSTQGAGATKMNLRSLVGGISETA